MAALVQALPQQTGTITLLQQPSSSSSGPLTMPSQPSQRPHPQSARGSQQFPRQEYTNAVYTVGYRGSGTTIPVAPYAFTSTPSLTGSGSSPHYQNIPPRMRPEYGVLPLNASPSGPYSSLHGGVTSYLQTVAPGSASISSSSTSSSSQGQSTKDDSVLPTRRPRPAGERVARPLSTGAFEALSAWTPPPSGKPSPDRYRRGNRRIEQTPTTAIPKGSGESITGQPTLDPPKSDSGTGVATNSSIQDLDENVDLQRKITIPRHSRGASADNVPVEKPRVSEPAKRYRRRSLGSLEAPDLAKSSESQTASEVAPILNSEFPLLGDDVQPPSDAPLQTAAEAPNTKVVEEKHTDSISVKNEPITSGTSPSRPESPPSSGMAQRNLDGYKRLTTPSPLSKYLITDREVQVADTKLTALEKQTGGKGPTTELKSQSPATKRLTELSKKSQRKSGKSRLRRALSFGNMAEMRKTSDSGLQPPEIKSRKQQLDEELGEEQAAIAERQEASGLGESIYSGQSNFFSGSTDNLSISSTASSASIMLRKMGNGVKRSTRSLVGLFRPKSVYNKSAEISVVEPSVPQVSRVTVEAQKETNGRIVTNDTIDQLQVGPGGLRSESVSPLLSVPGSPRGDRSTADGNHVQQPIVGGDNGRVEVLSTGRKGILKKMHSSSNNPSPVVVAIDTKWNDSVSRQGTPFSDSHRSSAPSTPVSEKRPRSGHRRTESVTIGGEDYFLPAGRLNKSPALSAPATPHPAAAKNISFSPRIQFHDTWPSGEYDRRGEVATCNRLTPLLAQQIKEELNTFKMEMEVHESSKIYTHFF